MLGPRHLTHALALAEHGTFRTAARALGMSQSALTRSIKVLEDHLEAPLFDRLSGGVRPTACGDVLLRWAAQITADTEGLLRELQQVRGLEAGEVRAALGPYPADLLAVPATTHLLRQDVGIQFTFRTCAWGEAHRRVRTRDVDVGIAELPLSLEDPLLEFELLGTHPLVWYCRPGHPLLKRKTLDIRDLVTFPWVGAVVTPRLTSPFPRRKVAAGTLDKQSGEFRPAIRVDEIEAARRVVRDSDALSAGLLTQIEEDLVRGSLCILHFKARWLHLNYGIILLRGPSSAPAVEAFLTTIRAIEQDTADRERRLRAQWCDDD